MLELRNLRTFYGNIMALKDVSIKVSQGEIITLIGANGAGKTTALMSISGVVPPRSGEVFFLGRPVQHLRPEEIAAFGIAHVPEGRHIFPQMTVTENLAMGAFLRHDRREIIKDRDYVHQLWLCYGKRENCHGGGGGYSS